MHLAERNIAIPSNPYSRKAIALAEDIGLLLKGMDVNHTLFTSSWPSLWNSFSEVWIVGGDGTLNYFINNYKDSTLPLSIFRAGTGNDFHNLLYENLTMEQQVENLLQRNIVYLDAGVCNGRLFMNGIGVGFDGKVVADLGLKKKNKLSYWEAIVSNIFTYKEFPYEMKAGEKQKSSKSFMISIANGQTYGGGFRVAPKAVTTDGLLDVSIIGKMQPLKRLWYVPVIRKGNHLRLKCTSYIQSQSLEIESAEVLPCHIDGEYFSASRLAIQCLPIRFPFLL